MVSEGIFRKKRESDDDSYGYSDDDRDMTERVIVKRTRSASVPVTKEKSPSRLKSRSHFVVESCSEESQEKFRR